MVFAGESVSKKLVQAGVPVEKLVKPSTTTTTHTSSSSGGATAIQPSSSAPSSGSSYSSSPAQQLLAKLTGTETLPRDVAGNVVGITELAKESEKAPMIMTDVGKIRWAEQRITTKGIHDTNIQPTEAKSVWGVTPNDIDYITTKSKIGADISAGITELSLELEFKKQFPEFEKNYLAYKLGYEQNIKDIKAGSPTDQWWIDVNKNAIQESSEIVSRDVALSLMEKQSPDVLQIDVGGGVTKTYSTLYTEARQSYSDVLTNIPKLRAGLVSETNLLAKVGAYEQAGYKLDVSDSGLSFSPMTAKETYDVVVPGVGGRALFLAKQWGMLGIPETVAVLTGKKEEYEESEYARILQLRKQPGESDIDYTKRFWTSPEAITQVYIPLATLGTGYLITGLSAGGRVIAPNVGKFASLVTGFGGTTAGRLTNVAIKSGVATVGIFGAVTTGATVLSTAIYNPDQLSHVSGQVLGSLGLASAGYLGGSSLISSKIPALATDIQGRPKVSTYLDIESIQKNIINPRTGGYNVGIIKGKIWAFAEGQKPGTGMLYKFDLKAFGSGGKNIGASPHVISAGKNVTLVKNIYEQVSRSYGKFFKSGGGKYIAEFEAYGKNTVPAPIKIGNVDLYISKESFVAGVYGKHMKPGVFTGKGFSLFRPVGTVDIAFGKTDITSGIFNKVIGTSSKVGEFDITQSFSAGKFESPQITGRYVEYGRIALFKGLKKSGFTIEPERIGKVDTFLKDTSASARLVYERINAEVIQPNIISAMSQTALNISNVFSPKVGGGLGYVNPLTMYVGLTTAISIPRTTTIQRSTQTHRLEYGTRTIQIPKLVPISEYKSISSQRAVPRLTYDTAFKQISVQRVSPLLSFDTGFKQVQVQKALQLQVQEQEQIQQQKLASISLVTPVTTIITPFVPFVLPPMGVGGGGGGGYGGGVFEVPDIFRKKMHPTKLLFKEIIVPKPYLKNW